MGENQERCLKCGKQQGLQGVAVTLGRKTFHLFYLCTKCGNVDIEELLKMIKRYIEKEGPECKDV
jgi:phage FluMu protein Com